jgi:predicted dehydrogenase
MIHENWRWRPHYRTIRKWLDADLIGDPIHTQMNLMSSGLIADSTGNLPALVRQPMLKSLDRLVIMEIMIHHIDCLRFLLGELELVYARYGRICDQVRGEDNAVLTLKTANCGSANVVANLSAYGYNPVRRDHFEINGRRGTIRLSANGLDLIGESRRSETFDLEADYAASYLAAIDHFLSCLADGSAFETAPEDNLKTLEIVEWAYSRGEVYANHA